MIKKISTSYVIVTMVTAVAKCENGRDHQVNILGIILPHQRHNQYFFTVTKESKMKQKEVTCYYGNRRIKKGGVGGQNSIELNFINLEI